MRPTDTVKLVPGEIDGRGGVRQCTRLKQEHENIAIFIWVLTKILGGDGNFERKLCFCCGAIYHVVTHLYVCSVGELRDLWQGEKANSEWCKTKGKCRELL